jgi:hypothetical protein
MTVEPAVGDEVCVLFKEEPGFAEQYATVMPMNLIAHTGAVRTPYGAVAFVVWQVAAGSPYVSFVETFLNPSTSALLVAAAARQSHLKLIIVNNQTSAVTAFVDYENNFGLDELEAIIGDVDGLQLSEFGDAVQYVLRNIDLVRAVRDAATGT